MRPNPLIAAADFSDAGEAERFAEELAGLVAFVKIGLELFTAAGPSIVERIRSHVPVFLDLKLHDIPATVLAAARNVARLGAELLTVHALGGVDMVKAAVDGAAEGASASGLPPPQVIAVTVLSSVGGEGLASPASLAFEAQTAGATGAVASGADVRAVREAVGPDMTLVVPGIRPGSQPENDHVRVLSPGEALELGADLIVVGRPITGAPDRVAAAQGILREIGLA